MALEAAEVLAVGRIRRPHGVHGEVLVEIATDFPARMAAGIEVGLGDAAPERWLHVDVVREHKGCWLLGFAGVGSRDEVEGWRGQWLFLPAQERSKLPPGYYYEHELRGATCLLLDGTQVGEIVELTSGLGTALLAVRTPGGEVLVPFAAPIVVKVDVAARLVVIDPPRGLVDGDAL